MSGTNKYGFAVNVNDSVSITAKVVSISGVGSLATLVVQAPLDAGTFTITANDANAVQHNDGTSPGISTLDSPNTVHPAVSIAGKVYGAAYDDLTVLGVVTSIAGSGINAILSVILKSSRATINTAAGNCSSAA